MKLSIKIDKPLFLIISIGILIRLFFFIYGLHTIPIYSDEAVGGLVTHEILKGHFNTFQFGQGYGGTFESFLILPLQLFLGSSKITLRLPALIVSIFTIFIIYKIAKIFFNYQIGLLSALLFAVPPPYILFFSTLAPPLNYTTFLGCIIMLWMVGVLTRKEKSYDLIWPWIVWGISGGISFWNHMITIAAIVATLLYCLLKDKKLFFRKGFWVGIIIFFICSSPFWIYNLIHSWKTFQIIKSVSFERSIVLFLSLFSFTLPALLGFHIPLFIDSKHFITIPHWLFILLGITYSTIIIIFIISLIKNLLRIITFKHDGLNGSIFLLFYILIVFAIFCRSNRAFWWTIRYIYYSFAALPVLIGFTLQTIRQKSKRISSIFIGIILFANIYGYGIVFSHWSNPQFVETMADLPETSYLIKFLQKENIQGIFTHFWLANRLMYETNCEIVCSDVYDPRFDRFTPYYLSNVEKKQRVAYVFYQKMGITPGKFEKALQKIGGKFKKKILGPFIIFYHFIPSIETTQKFRKVSLKNAEFSSNYNNIHAALVNDGNLKTRWGSHSPQKNDMIFNVKLDKLINLNKIIIHMGEFLSDRPRGLQIIVSENNKEWKEIYAINDLFNSLFWENNHPNLFIAKDYITVYFPPQKARYIKIKQTGSDSRFDWSIAELELYGSKKAIRDQ